MTSPLVSIVIPAYKPQWLGVAIESALNQTFTDFELLISDDSSGTEISNVVANWQDKRIQYVKNPDRGVPGANRDYLISLAKGEYIKFLFDDDFLLPRSVEVLLEAVQVSGCKLAFHNRHVVNDSGQIIESPEFLTGQGFAQISPELFFEQTVGSLHNRIGEPSNILMHTNTLKSMRNPFAMCGRRMRFLTDMALYANVAAQGHGIVGAAEFGSAFRRHGGQTSNQTYSGFSAGLFEWELLRRWAVDNRLLSESVYNAGNPNQMAMYTGWVNKYPELKSFIQLNGAPYKNNYMSGAFEEMLSLAYITIEMRKLSSAH
jgi:glycosyltransferase involved in cell wall biosynthesis